MTHTNYYMLLIKFNQILGSSVQNVLFQNSPATFFPQLVLLKKFLVVCASFFFKLTKIIFASD